jgi:hypothetical protein
MPFERSHRQVQKSGYILWNAQAEYLVKDAQTFEHVFVALYLAKNYIRILTFVKSQSGYIAKTHGLQTIRILRPEICDVKHVVDVPQMFDKQVYGFQLREQGRTTEPIFETKMAGYLRDFWHSANKYVDRVTCYAYLPRTQTEEHRSVF